MSEQEELQALAAAARAADTGVCDGFDPVDVSGVPAGFPVHGPLCGCNNLVGFTETREICRNCGRHPEVH